MSRARTFSEKGNAQKEILPKQSDFFRRFRWGMRKYRIHCHVCGGLSMKLVEEISHTVLLRSSFSLLRFSFSCINVFSERKRLCQKHKKSRWQLHRF